MPDLLLSVIRLLRLLLSGHQAVAIENAALRLLCIAKDASAGMSLCSNAFVTVMQTPELCDLDNPADTSDLPGNRALLVEA
jgi:hypothetical protein